MRKTPRERAFAQTVSRLQVETRSLHELGAGCLADGKYLAAQDHIREARSHIETALRIYIDNPLEEHDANRRKRADGE